MSSSRSVAPEVAMSGAVVAGSSFAMLCLAGGVLALVLVPVMAAHGRADGRRAAVAAR